MIEKTEETEEACDYFEDDGDNYCRHCGWHLYPHRLQ